MNRRLLRRPHAIPPLPHAIVERLPRIEWLTNRAVVARVRARELAERLADLGHPSPPPPLSTLPHVAELQEQLLAIEESAARAWDEVRRLGGQVADEEYGFVDFPVDGADGTVLFCWQLGEKTVDHWHLPDERCLDRVPIDPSTA